MRWAMSKDQSKAIGVAVNYPLWVIIQPEELSEGGIQRIVGNESANDRLETLATSCDDESKIHHILKV